MKKPVVIIDLDDTVVPFNQVFINWYQNKYQHKLGKPMKSFSYDGAYGTPKAKTWVGLIDEFYETQPIDSYGPYKQTTEILNNLKSKFELHIITARPSIHRAVTEVYIETYLPNVFTDLHMPTLIGDNHLKTDKGELAKSLNAVSIVDDADHNIWSAHKKGIAGILYKEDSHYWNALDLPKGTKVASDWFEVEEELNKHL